MNAFFTSDLHFGHENIIKLCNRPYQSTPDMDEILISNWNNRVRNSDIVYVLGDFAWKHIHEPYLKKLNGRKILIRGNHDESYQYEHASWHAIYDLHELYLNKHSLVLCHYAMRTWKGRNRGSLHLYGHSHGRMPADSQSCDVGVDCWDYKPVSFEEIKARLDTSLKQEYSV